MMAPGKTMEESEEDQIAMDMAVMLDGLFEKGDNEEDGEIQLGNVKWKDVTLNSEDQVMIAVGDTQEESWNQGMAELKSVRNMLHQKTGSKRPDLEECMGLFFGEEGKIFYLFKSTFQWTYPFFRAFLATAAYQHAFNISNKVLFDEDNRIDRMGFLKEEEYVDAWKVIGRYNLPQGNNTPNVSRTGVKFFWQLLQDAINEILRELFVVNHKNPDNDEFEELKKQIFVLDDFKVYFVTLIAEHAGLRISQHTRANRKGPVMHQLVRPASGMLAGIYFEKIGENEKRATSQLVEGQLTISWMDLGGIEFALDRAYTTKQTTEELVFTGAAINGTKAMTLDSPFVYGKQLRDWDKRTELDKDGATTLWIKYRTVKVSRPNGGNQKRKVFIHAYRKNRNITLGITTIYPSFQWEFIVKNPMDLKWYDEHVFRFAHGHSGDESDEDEEDKKEKLVLSEDIVYRKCFPSVYDEEISDGFLDQFAHLSVTPITTTQRSAEWFFLRSFSCTSRTVNSMIMILINADPLEIRKFLSMVKCDVPEFHYGMNEIWKYLGMDAIEFEKEGADGSGTESVETEKLEIDDVIGEFAGTDKFISEFEQYKSELDRIGKYLGNKTNLTKGVSKRWLQSPFQIRHAFFQKDQLLRKYNSLSGEYHIVLMSQRALSVNAIRSALTKYYEQHPEDRDVIPAKKPTPQSRAKKKLSIEQELLKSMLRSTFMQKIEGQGRNWARRGTNNEEPLAKRMFDDLKDGKKIPGLFLKEMCHTPLVTLQPNTKGSGGYSGLNDIHNFRHKCSADFLCYGSYEEEDFVMGVEVKTRVTDSTINHTQEIIAQAQVEEAESRLDHSIGRGNTVHGKIYYTIEWDDEILQKFVSDLAELIQILHCASVYSCDHWMLLIGTERYVIVGIIVHFPKHIRERWIHLLIPMGFAAARPLLEEKWNSPEVEEVMKQVKFSGGATLDKHSLRQHWYLYNGITKHCMLPLPECSYILPKFVARWNANKSGSDTRSKYMSHAEYNPPSKLIQANVVDLMLGECFTSIHKLIQLATAKADLTKYPSLLHYRNAATQRFSLKSTLLQCSKILGKAEYKKQPTGLTKLSHVTPMTIDRKVTRSSKDYTTITVTEQITGITPQRKCAEMYERLKSKPSDMQSIHEKHILQRMMNCTGNPILLADVQPEQAGNDTFNKKRATCFACGKDRAQVYCLGCHSYYHMGKEGDFCGKGLKIRFQNSTKSVIPKVTCYHYCHPAALGDKNVFAGFKTPDHLANAKTAAQAEKKNKVSKTAGKRKKVSFSAEETGQSDEMQTTSIQATPAASHGKEEPTAPNRKDKRKKNKKKK